MIKYRQAVCEVISESLINEVEKGSSKKKRFYQPDN
jgi:hypothetical protein